jgi:FkbM family methyltransferase
MRQFPDQQKNLLIHCDESKSQLNQDLVALASNNFAKGGFFVEFGAADGLLHSNSYYLETKFGWKGILVEPVARQYQECLVNRASTVLHAAVTGASGEIVNIRDRGLFTKSVKAKKLSSVLRRVGSGVEQVVGVSLNDILSANKAPKCIGFLSMDTEGSELEILKNFNFVNCVHFVAIEHNFTAARSEIEILMKAQGFTEILREVSSFDSWWEKECKSHQ